MNGQQGNIPGTNSVTKHQKIATGGSMDCGYNRDTHLPEGNVTKPSGMVIDPKQPKGKGSMGSVSGANQK